MHQLTKLSLWFGLLILLNISFLWGQASLQEEIFIQSDRNVYVGGEEIWVSVNCVEALSGSPSPLSKVAYIELWDNNGIFRQQQKVSLVEGKGLGRLSPSTTLASGYYHLRTYTRWMQNQPASDFAEQTIVIVQDPDQNKPLPIAASEEIGQKPEYRVQIFPAGGSWVAGISQELGIAISPRTGESLIGYFTTQAGDTLARFIPNATGKASIQLTGQLGARYEIHLQRPNGASQKFSLAPPTPSGLSLELSQLEGNFLGIRGLGQRISPKSLLCHLYKGGIELSSQELPLKDGKLVESLKLPQGLSGLVLITLEDPEGALIAHRYTYLRPATQPELKLEVDKRTLSPGSSLSLNISYQDQAGKPLKGQVGVSVSRKLKSTYLKSHSTDRYNWLSLLCRPLPSLVDSPAFLPSWYGPVVSGRVMDRQGNRIPNATVWLSFPGPSAEVKVLRSDASGRFTASFPNRRGPQSMIYFAESAEGRPMRIKLDRAVPGNIQRPVPINFAFASQDQALAQELVQTYRLHQAFRKGKVEKTDESSRVALSFYGEPDEAYELANYTRFVMEETFREIVYYVRVKGLKPEDFRLSVEDKQTFDLMPGPPLVLVDGVPILDERRIFDINTKDIEKIEVVRDRYQLNHLTFDGLIHIHSFNQQATNVKLPEYYTREVINFPMDAAPFAGVKEEKDFLNTLYWQPSLPLDEAGNLSLEIPISEALGTYYVTVSAIGPDGQWIEVEEELEVKLEAER